MYISLPAVGSENPYRHPAWRSPLTPPTITPPSLTACHSVTSRIVADQCSSPTEKAKVMLARVVVSPSSPQRPPARPAVRADSTTSMSSDTSTSTQLEDESDAFIILMEKHSSNEKRADDGYFSFPDFDQLSECRAEEFSWDSQKQ